jgi:hypothetical protein
VRNLAITQAALVVEHATPFRQVVRDYAHQLGLAIDHFKLMMFVSFLTIPLAGPGAASARDFRQRSSSRDPCKSVRSREVSCGGFDVD